MVATGGTVGSVVLWCTVAHIYDFLTLLLGVPSQGFIAGRCQEDCKALSSIRTIWKLSSDRLVSSENLRVSTLFFFLRLSVQIQNIKLYNKMMNYFFKNFGNRLE